MMMAAFPPPILFLKRQKENGRWSRPREKTLGAELAPQAQVRLNTGVVLKGCHQFCTHLPARAILVPRIGFPRVYTLAVNAGGRGKAHPPGPADATPALQGSASGKRSRGVRTLQTHAPSTPRAGICLESGTLPQRETFFLFHRARRIFFLMSQKENGGCIPAGKAGHPRAL